MDNFDRTNTIHLILITIAIIVAVPTIIYAVSRVSWLNLLQTSNIVSGIGSILLSAILAYLYLQMWETQKERTNVQQNQEEILDEQTKIQREQQNMMRTDKESLLDILKHDVSSTNNCVISVSNYGGGAVVELQLRTYIEGGEKSDTLLTRVGPDYEDGGRIIGPNEKNVEIGCCPSFTTDVTDSDITGDFPTITTKLSNEGYEEIQVKIDLIATGEFGNRSSETLIDDTVSIYGNMDLEELDGWKNN